MVLGIPTLKSTRRLNSFDPKSFESVELSQCRLKSVEITFKNHGNTRFFRRPSGANPVILEFSEKSVELSQCRLKSYFLTSQKHPSVELSQCRVKSFITVVITQPLGIETSPFSSRVMRFLTILLGNGVW